MGTKERREREKEQRRKKILAATSELFLEKGYDSTTIEDIANKVELSTGTIYQYFKNKEELYATINLMGASSILSKVEKAVHKKSLSPEQKIMKLKDAMYKTLKTDTLGHRTMIRILTEDILLTLSSELREQIKDITRRLLYVIANVYQEGVQQGEFQERHYIALADIIWSMFLGLAILEEAKHKLDPKKNYLKSTLNMAFEIFLEGLKKKDS